MELMVVHRKQAIGQGHSRLSTRPEERGAAQARSKDRADFEPILTGTTAYLDDGGGPTSAE